MGVFFNLGCGLLASHYVGCLSYFLFFVIAVLAVVLVFVFVVRSVVCGWVALIECVFFSVSFVFCCSLYS